MNLILNIPIFKLSVFLSFLCYLFITFLTSPVFKSTSIIDVSSENEQISTSSSFLDSFGGTSAKDAFQLKSYLESKEASNFFEQNADIEKIFSNEEIKYLSRYRLNGSTSFHDYFIRKIDITIDADSNSVIISTDAFNASDALYINLELINMASEFFNRKARLSSINSKASKICELYSINSNILNIEPIEYEYDEKLVEKSESANELLILKSQNYRDFCLENFNSRINSSENDLNLFPSFEIKNINAGASKQILADIYNDSLDSITSSNNIQIIAEPVKSDNYESLNRLVYCILVFAISFILLVTLKVVIRLRNEFEV